MRILTISTLLLLILPFIGNTQTVRIGKQVWSTKNLDVTTFRNGDTIPQAKTNEEWVKFGDNKQAAWCYYNNDPTEGTKYGKLYNWYAVNDPRGLAPKGYHIPNDTEWIILGEYLGETLAGKKMKNNYGWVENGSGTNESGFSGLPSGGRYYDGSFNFILTNGGWWSSTEIDTDLAWAYDLGYLFDRLNRGKGFKGCGSSVRCLVD